EKELQSCPHIGGVREDRAAAVVIECERRVPRFRQAPGDRLRMLAQAWARRCGEDTRAPGRAPSVDGVIADHSNLIRLIPDVARCDAHIVPPMLRWSRHCPLAPQARRARSPARIRLAGLTRNFT